MEKRAIVAKFLVLVSFLIVSLLSIPFASAAVDFKILDQTLGQLHKILGMDTVVFGILVFLLFFLLYGVFALGLSRSRLGGDNGRLNRNGRIIAISLAGVVIISTFFVRKNVLSFAKTKLAPQFNLFFAVILGVLMFMLFRWLGQQTFRDREDMANVFGIFAVGLALSMFGAIGNARWAEGIGLTLIIISAIWLLVLLISGAGGPDDRRRRREPNPPPPPPPGRATIWGIVTDAATGNAIRNAQVSTTIEGHQYTSATNRHGHYRLYSMPQSDNVVVQATADGYEDWTSEAINLTEDRRMDIPMMPEEPPHQVYHIRVQVLDATPPPPHVPIQNNDTLFYYSTPHDPMPHEIPAEHIHPQGNGVYILDIIYAGAAPPPPIPGIVGATSPGYHPNPAAVPIPDISHPAHQYEILLTPDHGPPGGDVNVQVVDAAGHRIISPATRFRLSLPGPGPTNEVDPANYIDNGDGSYVIPEATLNPILPVGGGATTVSLGARSPGHPNNDKAVNVDFAALLPMYTIQLGGGPIPPPPPPGTFSITGTVNNENGDPVNGARVELNPAHHANTDAAGNYVIDNIPNAEAGPAVNITVSCADHQTRVFARGLNPDVANNHDFVISRFTFRIIITNNDDGSNVTTINDPYSAAGIPLPDGINLMIRLQADPVNGRFDPATPAAERTFEIPGIVPAIEFNIIDENTAELAHTFTVPLAPAFDLIFDIRVIDR
jgi:hypothetical protein